MRVAIVTAGTRGDVQPCVAFAAGLQQSGHTVRLVTTKDFTDLAGDHGIECRGMDVDSRGFFCGDLGDALARKGSIGFAFQMAKRYRALLEQTYEETRSAAEWADVLIHNAITACASHVAEGAGRPSWGLFPQPWTTTAEFASPGSASIPVNLGGLYNRLTHLIVHQLAWYCNRPVVNGWRTERLGLSPIGLFGGDFRRMEKLRHPILYAFSRHVVPKPADWGDWVHVTGYCFLNSPAGWDPPVQLVEFIDRGSPPVYIGFGSWPVPDPEELSKTIVRALELAEQRGVIHPGWGGIGNIDLPDDVFKVDSVPHDWLFRRMAAVVHHGGAGTTAAGLRAGVPSVLVPFMGDQFFWAKRLEKMKVGPKPVPRSKLTAEALAQAMTDAVTNDEIRSTAAAVGEQIRAEDGVRRAVDVFEESFR